MRQHLRFGDNLIWLDIECEIIDLYPSLVMLCTDLHTSDKSLHVEMQYFYFCILLPPIVVRNTLFKRFPKPHRTRQTELTWGKNRNRLDFLIVFLL